MTTYTITSTDGTELARISADLSRPETTVYILGDPDEGDGDTPTPVQCDRSLRRIADGVLSYLEGQTGLDLMSEGYQIAEVG